MSKKYYALCVLVFSLIIFVLGLCLVCDSGVALPVITVDWEYIKDGSDCCCGGNGSLGIGA